MNEDTIERENEDKNRNIIIEKKTRVTKGKKVIQRAKATKVIA